MGNTSTKNKATHGLTEEEKQVKSLTEEELFAELKKQLDDPMRSATQPYCKLSTSASRNYFNMNVKKHGGVYNFCDLIDFLDIFKRPYVISMGPFHELTIHFVQGWNSIAAEKGLPLLD
jgi:hypothetical protein